MNAKYWIFKFVMLITLMCSFCQTSKNQELTLLLQSKTLAPAAVRHNPHLIFPRRESTRGLKFGTQTKLTLMSSGNKFPKDMFMQHLSWRKQKLTLIPTRVVVEMWPLIKGIFFCILLKSNSALISTVALSIKGQKTKLNYNYFLRNS